MCTCIKACNIKCHKIKIGNNLSCIHIVEVKCISEPEYRATHTNIYYFAFKVFSIIFVYVLYNKHYIKKL
jgi:hypothetical protein